MNHLKNHSHFKGDESDEEDPFPVPGNRSRNNSRRRRSGSRNSSTSEFHSVTSQVLEHSLLIHRNSFRHSLRFLFPQSVRASEDARSRKLTRENLEGTLGAMAKGRRSPSAGSIASSSRLIRFPRFFS